MYDETKARVNEEVAGVSAGGAGVGTNVGQAQGATGAFQEGGFGFNSDIAVTELLKMASGLMAVSAATLKASLDGVASARATNAAMVDNLAALSNQRVQDDSNKAGQNINNMAADRMWNVNETDFYSVVAAAVSAAMAEKSFDD